MLICFSKKQAEEHNIIKFENGQEIWIETKFDTNQFSVEVARVLLVNSAQTFFKAGDEVLCDFGIFTLGRNAEAQMTTENRLIGETDEDLIYWCSDGTHPSATTEVYAKILLEQNNSKTLVPFPGLVFLEEQTADKLEKSSGGILLNQRDDREEKPFFALVVASSKPELAPGMFAFCEPFLSIPVKFDGKRYEYIGCSNILGYKKPGETNVTLF